MAKKIPNPVDKHAGSRVRMRRVMLSMSQEKLGDALGLTFQQVQKYEKGSNRMGSSRLQQIANVLQVPVTFFFDGAPGQIKAKGDAPSPALTSSRWNFLIRGGSATVACAVAVPDLAIPVLTLVSGVYSVE